MASVYKRKNSKSWYIRYKRADGRWTDVASTASTKTEAKRLAKELENEAWRERQ